MSSRSKPKRLNTIGKKTWVRIWETLEAEGRAESTDPIIVETVAYLFQLYAEYTEKIKELGSVMEYTNKGGQTNLVKNPLAIEIPKIIEQIRKLLAELALTPASRKRLQEQLTENAGDDFENF
ncbi:MULTISPECIES: phage terminase small subunit P27 family [Thermoactinomyces]|uniref:Phage terminase small subunit P27 family n=1 Tax=Thermoactinomyces daqus TaxID=1329516 RepID=A0A7W2AJY7_9BACL|nr:MULTISPECIES: phage terminase small subunit P27 family [Thermoactinomyces]MBA4544363.1 phage terminase small subunit P27 family [Thermoactinomyces daqus]MBH8609111.1 phage terminase small subunit P27 family [Thermoactinomyces sp. CICC 10521]